MGIRLRVAVATGLLASVAAGGVVSGAIGTAAASVPVISEVAVPSQAQPGTTITFTWRVQSAAGLAPVTAVVGSDIVTVPGTWVKIGGSSGWMSWCGFPVYSQLVAGTSVDGRYSASCTLPATLPNGSYQVWIETVDVNGLRSSNNGVDAFAVTAGSSDVSAPSISNVVASPAIAAAGGNVTITWAASDETGVASIVPWAWGPNGRLVDDAGVAWLGYDVGRLVTGSAQNGTYEISLPLSATAAPGTYVVWFSSSDVVGNREAQLGPGGFESGFATFTVSSTSTDVVGIPTNTTAQPQASQTVRVSFTPPPVGRMAVTDYDVRYSTSSSFASPVFVEGGTTTTTWSNVAGLRAGTTYYFQVRASNMAGDGSWSRTSNAVTVVSPPGAATSLVATRTGAGSARVTFAPAPSSGAPIIDYDLQYSTSSGFASGVVFVEAGTSSATRIDVTRLASRVTYFVRVRATNSAGDGPWSAAIAVRV